MLKICNKCKIEKTHDQFDRKKYNSGKFGLASICKPCRNERENKKNRSNPDVWKKRNKISYQKHKSKFRDRQLKNNFGITIEQYDQLFRQQDGKCAICSRPEESVRNGLPKHLAVDHCHKTGTIRGLLCGKCNKALGLFRDSGTVLAMAIKYMQKRSS